MSSPFMQGEGTPNIGSSWGRSGAPSPVPKCEGPGAPSFQLGIINRTGGTLIAGATLIAGWKNPQGRSRHLAVVSAVAAAALMRRRDAHVFAVFGDGAAGKLDALHL